MRIIHFGFLGLTYLSLGSCIMVDHVTAGRVYVNGQGKLTPCEFTPPQMKTLPLALSPEQLNGSSSEVTRILVKSLQEHRKYISDYMVDLNNTYADYKAKCTQ